VKKRILITEKITAPKEYWPLKFKVALFSGRFYFSISEILQCFFFSELGRD